MERSRDGYRGRYRDRHNNRNHNHEDRSTRGNYRRFPSPHNGHHSSRNSPTNGYNYRSSRPSFSSRTSSSTQYRHHHHNDDYPRSSSSNRTSSANSSQSNYYDHHSPSSRSFTEQSIPSNSLYYSSPPRDRGLPLLSTQFIASDRNNRYMPLTHRRDSSPPVSSYRNERSMEYNHRSSTHDIYMRDEYRPPSPLSLAPLSVRGDPYGDIYRTNDYGTRSERYDLPSNRTPDYSNYHHDSYRNPSMPSYIPPAVSYQPRSRSRDDELPPPPSSSIDRTSHARPNLKRSGSRYHDNEAIPSKRAMRR